MWLLKYSHRDIINTTRNSGLYSSPIFRFSSYSIYIPFRSSIRPEFKIYLNPVFLEFPFKRIIWLNSPRALIRKADVSISSYITSSQDFICRYHQIFFFSRCINQLHFYYEKKNEEKFARIKSSMNEIKIRKKSESFTLLIL